MFAAVGLLIKGECGAGGNSEKIEKSCHNRAARSYGVANKEPRPRIPTKGSQRLAAPVEGVSWRRPLSQGVSPMTQITRRLSAVVLAVLLFGGMAAAAHADYCVFRIENTTNVPGNEQDKCGENVEGETCKLTAVCIVV